MSSTEGTPPGEQPSQAAAVLTTKQLLEVLKDNFVLLSASAVIMGIGLATIFLASYLSVFDWHLLWFVQYTDIVTFGLIAVGIIGGSFFVIQGAAQSVLGAAEIEGKSRRTSIIIATVIFALLLASQLYFPIRHGEPHFHILFGAATLLSGVVLIYVIASHIRVGSVPTVGQVTSVILLAISCAGGLGQWLGRSIEETSEFDQDVSIKNEIIKSAKVIIVLSRHTVLLKDRILYVVPTGDITKFQTSHELITIPLAPTGSK